MVVKRKCVLCLSPKKYLYEAKFRKHSSKSLVCEKQNCHLCFYVLYFSSSRRLHDDSANDDSAIDKMAARFWHTDDSATFLFEIKSQKNFPTPHGFHLKTFPTPYGCQKGLILPLTGFFYPWRELIFSLKKLFLTPNLLQIGKNGLNWPSFFYVT